jgi:ferric-dicitrate binding protein FerR (iron transport regulator)
MRRILSVAYGEASWWDRRCVARWARRDPRIADLVAEHRRVATAVHALPSRKAPARAVESAWHFVQSDQTRAPWWRPVLASGAVLATAACFLILVLSPGPKPVSQEAYSKAEVEQARRQIEAAFLLVNRSVQRAGLALNDDVLVPNVACPIRKGATIVNELFGKENPS